MKVDLPEQRKVRIEMLPLIDIVFLLLVFFIYAMLSMAVHRGLPVTLPTSSSAEIEKDLILSVTLREDGAIYLDETRVSMESLTENLKKKARQAENKGVLLFADRTVSYQRLFHVLDRIKKAGLNRVSLQAEAKQGQ